MLKTIVKLLVAALILNAGFRAATAYYHWFTFKDDVTQIAIGAAKQSTGEVTDRVLKAAEARGAPVARADIRVEREPDRTAIDISYTERIELVPSYVYPWTFTVKTDERHRKPTTPDDILGR